MTTKINTYLLFVIAFGVLLANAVISFASDDFESVELPVETSDEEIVREDGESPDATGKMESNEPAPLNPTTEQEEFLKKLKDELNISKTEYRQLLDSIAATKTRLNQVSDDRLDLEGQLQVIDDQIALSTAKLIDVLKRVVEKENEIKIIQEQMEIKEIAIENQREMLRDYIRIMYTEENEYIDVQENGEIDAFKLLLSDDSVGENLRKLKYFDMLNEAGQQLVDQLDGLNRELAGQRNSLREKRESLKELKDTLAREKENLELQKDSKENLLRVTKGQEQIYEQLVEQSILEQNEVLADLKILSSAISFIEEKIREEGAGFDINKYSDIIDDRTKALYNFRINTDDFDGFIWPVVPLRGLSAYFRDPGYRGVFGVGHNAVDIPTYQGTPIQAAADGVVYTAKDNGYGYSYIILAHADGFMSVYGHVSEILVQEGETVAQGGIIGMSGGMPGTKGAGYMTTGPHLHFEVLKNGTHSDPLDYLSLDVLTREQLEAQLPEKYYDKWEADSFKAALKEDDFELESGYERVR